MTVRAFPSDFELLLASQSPRRSQLLSAVGVPYRVVDSSADESSGDLDPVHLARSNALAKARGARIRRPVAPGTFVLGTDTVVVIDDRILGKPADLAEARGMLQCLSGRRHEVVSGVALLRGPEAEAVGHAVTGVRFRALEPADLDAYLASGEWSGKAGAYAIQGLAALAVDGIEGEYANVVGLPLALLSRLFRQLGFDLLRGRWV